MRKVRYLCLALICICLLGQAVPAMAAEVECDAAYCFSAGDFTDGEEALAGICITGLPASDTGTVMLGSRVLREGDILTAGQVEQMTFQPLQTREDKVAEVVYLPIFENRVEPAAVMALSIRGKENKAPVAQDSALETYKNLSNEGKLMAMDPEGEMLTYTLVRQPRRGAVELGEDGSFTYTPKKNKVGVDSFTYTATDPAGNVSREATVTVQILKPTDAAQYQDTVGRDCRFAAEWMKNTGIFVGESINGNGCFQPEKQVSRGEFLTMLVGALEIPLENDATFTGFTDESPDWLKPYLAAAIRSGLTAGLPEEADGCFHAELPITGAEAAVMLQNALDLTISRETVETAATEQTDTVPVWAQVSLTALADHGIGVSANEPVTRGELAQVLYKVNALAQTSAGVAVLRMQ